MCKPVYWDLINSNMNRDVQEGCANVLYLACTHSRQYGWWEYECFTVNKLSLVNVYETEFVLRSLMAWGKKLLLSLSVFAIMLLKRLPDGSKQKRWVSVLDLVSFLNLPDTGTLNLSTSNKSEVLVCTKKSMINSVIIYSLSWSSKPVWLCSSVWVQTTLYTIFLYGYKKQQQKKQTFFKTFFWVNDDNFWKNYYFKRRYYIYNCNETSHRQVNAIIHNSLFFCTRGRSLAD